MNKQPEPLTAGLLKELIGDRCIPKLQALIENKADDELLDIIDRNDYVATKLWSKDDIIGTMENMGTKATEENIKKVLAQPELKRLNDCTDEDWSIIENAIKTAIRTNTSAIATFTENSEQYKKLDDAAKQIASETGKQCQVETVAFDISQGWLWTTITMESGLNTFPSMQLLCPKEQTAIIYGDALERTNTIHAIIKRHK